jgi:serine/threonine protein kinase
MVCGKPFFPGTKVEDELYLIFKVLGTPDEDTLPGVTANAEFITLNSTIRQYSRMDMATLVPRLDADGIDLLSGFLKYNPKLRLSAHDAIVHKYFSTFPSSVYSLDNSKSSHSINSISIFLLQSGNTFYIFHQDQSIFDVTTINLAKDLGSKLNSTSGMKFSFLYG